MRVYIKLISLIMSLCLLITSSGCTASSYSNYSASFNNIESSVFYETDNYSPDLFYAYCSHVEDRVKNDDEAGAFEYFDKVMTEYEKIQDVTSLIELAYTTDITNEYYSDQYEYIFSINDDVCNRLTVILGLLIKTYPDRLSEYFGNDWVVEYYADSSVPDGYSELQNKELELMSEYYSVANEIDSFVYEYNGKYYSYSDIDENLRAELGDDAYNEIKTGCLKQYNAAVGEVFVELVKVRDQIAEMCGYDTYSEYADENIYFRDYSADDLKLLYSAIKPVAYKYQSLKYTESFDIRFDSLVDLLDFEEKIAGELSEYTQNAFDVLIEKNLLVATDSSNAIDTSYTCKLYTDDSAFIFLNLKTGLYDLSTFTHELGHFTEMIVNSERSSLERTCFDVAEIHSTGNEALAIGACAEYLTKKSALTFEVYELNEMLYSIVYGCIYDEWLRFVFDNPDLSLDEVNEAFERIALEYGREDEEWLGYSWVTTIHNFVSPQYYISYGTSAIIALQLYELAETDRNAAIEAWDYIVECGTDSYYLETITNAGLIPFTDTEYTVELFNRCADTVLEIKDKYNY